MASRLISVSNVVPDRNILFQYQLGEFNQLHLIGALGAGVEHMGLVFAELPQGFRLAHTPTTIQHDQLAPVLLIFIL